MTKSKIERCRQALIDKFGDLTIIIVVDSFYGRPVFSHKLSTINISCTADLREVERIIMTGRPRTIRAKI